MTNDHSSQNGLSLSGLYSLLIRRKGILAVSFVFLFGAVLLLVLLRGDKYESELRLIVKQARTEDVIEGGGDGLGVSDSEIASEIELIWSRSSLEKVARDCGLVEEVKDSETDPKRRLAMAVEEMMLNLSVERIGGTHLISVKYSHEDPKQAARVTRAIGDVYLAKHMAIHRHGDTSQFFEKQIAIHEKELAEAQKAVAEFRQRHEVSLLAAEKEASLRRQNELQDSLQDLDSQINDAKDRIRSLRSQIGELPETIETASRLARNQVLIERLKSTLLELENKRTTLLTKYDENYRLVGEVDQQIKDTKAMLASEQTENVVDRTQGVNPLRQSLRGDLLRTETNLSGLQAKRAKVARTLAEVKHEARALEQITGEYDDSVRRVTLAEDNLVLYRKKREESRLAEAMDQQHLLNVSVVEEPEAPAVPSDQYRAFLIALGVLLAGFGSVAVALFTDQSLLALRDAHREIQADAAGAANVEAAEAHNGEEEEPLYSAEPIEVSEAEYQREPDDRTAQPGHAASAGFSDVAEVSVDVLETESSDLRPVVRPSGALARMMSGGLALHEDYGAVVDYIASLHKRDEGLAIGLSAAISARDAAVAAVQLSESMQRRNGLPVLLLDSGARDGALAEFFGAARLPGLRELLQGPPGRENQCVHRTSFDRMWILPAGDLTRNGVAVAERESMIQKALAKRSLNLIVYLADGSAPESQANGEPKGGLLPFSVLDAVLPSLNGVVSNGDVDQIMQSVVKAKQRFSERRLTLVGVVEEWRDTEKKSLRVC